MSSSELAPVAGIRAVLALLEHAPGRVKRVLYARPAKGARAEVIAAAERHGVVCEAAGEAVLRTHAGELRHQGIVALAAPRGYEPWPRLIGAEAALIVAVDQITDPRNLGALLRSAEALGATGALVTRNRCARLGPTVTRTSAGASELLPVAMEANLVRALAEAREAGLQVVGAAAEGQAIEAIDWTRPTVLVIGAEDQGLRPSTRAACDALAAIPLRGVTESLNAAVAGAVLLYAAVDARRTGSQRARAAEEST